CTRKEAFKFFLREAREKHATHRRADGGKACADMQCNRQDSLAGNAGDINDVLVGEDRGRAGFVETVGQLAHELFTVGPECLAGNPYASRGDEARAELELATVL